jgi:UDPglucose 6-dehydrogenase
MTKIGFIGLGKLGMPVAVSLARVFDVVGHDVTTSLMDKNNYPHREAGPDGTGDFKTWLASSKIRFGTLQETVEHADVIYLAIQTPHHPEYEGTVPLPPERVDFDYSYLRSAAENVAKFVKPSQTVVVISTTLPGSIRREVMPVLKGKCRLVYNPFFIAMGTVMRDFLHPEFVLIGTDREADQPVIDVYQKFYLQLTGAVPPICRMTIESAELTKVAYNTFISTKLTFVNMLMEVCHQVGADVDSVTGALCKGTDRLLSPKYMTAGMGDGGGCHPRDNIAMSYLARKLNLSCDIFENLMLARQHQAHWLVNLMKQYDLPKIILGKSFKPETNIVTGSPALLCAELLRRDGFDCTIWDPHVDADPLELKKAVYLIGTKHNEFRDFTFPRGSVVLDPHRYIPDAAGVTVIRIGQLP